ncbi:MAG: hypothetical protein HC929_18600 [Leptolyngbyaceae cyanobacterium SM2_5_2]|nr:hypothetical protein [Leptolyngbyaceae cyanobacterium SM2_5_2]
MSAALKSYVPRPLPAQHLGAGQRTQNPAFSRPSRPQAEPARPSSLPVSAAPSRLMVVLGQVHLVSSVLATALVGLTLVGYGASVYVDRQLNQATQRLSELQRNEQQLATATAVLTSHMAQQAEDSASGLQAPKPDQVIFLKPAPARPGAAPSAVVPPWRWLGYPSSPMGY